MNMDSILTSTKKLLGITEEYDHFDKDIIMHINSAFADLMQIGVGPYRLFRITDKSTVWSDFVSDDIWYASMIPEYIYAKVKVKFDPPTNGSHLEALKETIRETEFRLNVAAESDPFGVAGGYKVDYNTLENIPSINGETLVGNYDEQDPTVEPISTESIDEAWDKQFKE